MHPFEDLKVREGQIGLHWFGQNSWALKDVAGTIVQVDPYFPHNRPPERFIHAEPPLDEAALRTDLVLLTHDHGDHTCLESLQRLHAANPEARFVGPVESVRRMREGGIAESQLTVIEAGESMTFGDVMVCAFWSKPPEGAPEDGIRRPDVAHLGYLIELGGQRVYVTGDLINTFGDHDELIAPVAAMAPDLGLITMHPTEGEFPFFEGAVKLAVKLGVKAVVPAHYACFVKRTYDPYAFAALLPEGGPEALIIPYNSAVVFPA